MPLLVRGIQKILGDSKKSSYGVEKHRYAATCSRHPENIGDLDVPSHDAVGRFAALIESIVRAHMKSNQG